MFKTISSILIFIVLFSMNSEAQTVVYSGRYGHDAIVHIDDNVIYKGRYGYDAIMHIIDGVIYKERYGYDAIAHVDDGVIYKGKYGYDAIARIDGYISDIQLYALYILILNL